MRGHPIESQPRDRGDFRPQVYDLLKKAGNVARRTGAAAAVVVIPQLSPDAGQQIQPDTSQSQTQLGGTQSIPANGENGVRIPRETQNGIRRESRLKVRTPKPLFDFQRDENGIHYLYKPRSRAHATSAGIFSTEQSKVKDKIRNGSGRDSLFVSVGILQSLVERLGVHDDVASSLIATAEMKGAPRNELLHVARDGLIETVSTEFSRYFYELETKGVLNPQRIKDLAQLNFSHLPQKEFNFLKDAGVLGKHGLEKIRRILTDIPINWETPDKYEGPWWDPKEIAAYFKEKLSSLGDNENVYGIGALVGLLAGIYGLSRLKGTTRKKVMNLMVLVATACAGAAIPTDSGASTARPTQGRDGSPQSTDQLPTPTGDVGADSIFAGLIVDSLPRAIPFDVFERNNPGANCDFVPNPVNPGAEEVPIQAYFRPDGEYVGNAIDEEYLRDIFHLVDTKDGVVGEANGQKVMRVQPHVYRLVDGRQFFDFVKDVDGFGGLCERNGELMQMNTDTDGSYKLLSNGLKPLFRSLGEIAQEVGWNGNQTDIRDIFFEEDEDGRLTGRIVIQTKDRLEFIPLVRGLNAEVQLLATPTPSPTPEPTMTDTPEPSATPTPTDTPTPTEIPILPIVEVRTPIDTWVGKATLSTTDGYYSLKNPAWSDWNKSGGSVKIIDYPGIGPAFEFTVEEFRTGDDPLRVYPNKFIYHYGEDVEWLMHQKMVFENGYIPTSEGGFVLMGNLWKVPPIDGGNDWLPYFGLEYNAKGIVLTLKHPNGGNWKIIQTDKKLKEGNMYDVKVFSYKGNLYAAINDEIWVSGPIHPDLVGKTPAQFHTGAYSNELPVGSKLIQGELEIKIFNFEK